MDETIFMDGFYFDVFIFVYSLISYPFSVIITGYFIQLTDVIKKKLGYPL